MTNEDFVAALSQQLNLETKKTLEILATAITIISEKLAEGARISVENFGILDTEKTRTYFCGTGKSTTISDASGN